ncbi:heparinase II/III family protein [Paracoccus sp. SCSIO 75233]|uniref:heparinase II/III domain-containing protein n=1 Tax=Paracoccus sp. SCSIO 75233 TaxID=3017782 RepID=UPI0022F0A195|nr:heparinase II/III family protein [Paracoccus sp. SCSIO 75233]WBU52443.1 heparinase II/III family protein [Paracoccus sp. SCSIO 75233]
MMRSNRISYDVLQKYLPAPSDSVSKAAKDIVERRGITISSYKDVPIAEKFWLSGDQDNRAWMFSLHNFSVLNALMVTGEWQTIDKLIQEWVADFAERMSSNPSEFPWHDHATALRLDRLSLIALATDGKTFPELAEQHAKLLLCEDFYSKHTNHGYDQALALLFASYAFSDVCDTTEWQKIGLARLSDELRFAFNEEGVHVENSPAYHVGMTANLVRARLLLEALDLTLDFDFDELLNKALLFTSWMIGPDRKLALLGDSTERGGTAPSELEGLPNFQHAIYAASGGAQGQPLQDKVAIFPHAGYAVYRSNWQPWRDHVHLVMKSGFLSRYHRQDDDLNILLHAYGEPWLIDSGLYNHNEHDEIRKYMRSAMAHNVPFVQGVLPSRNNIAPDFASIELDDSAISNAEAVFRGETRMYRGIRLRRTVIVENKDNFQIVDNAISGKSEAEVFILFHTPKNKQIRTSPTVARIIGREKELSIRVASGEVGGCRVFSGREGEFWSLHSGAHNKCEPSKVIVFGPVKTDQIRFRLSFS